jgi:hypothetical protein
MIFVIRRLMDIHWEYNKPLYITFLDLEKALDRVPRRKLWEVLRRYNIYFGHLLWAISSMYRRTINRVATGSG